MGRRFLFAEFFDRHDFDLRLWQATEQIRQLGVHLVSIFLVEVDDRLARLEVELWILLDRSIEGL